MTAERVRARMEALERAGAALRERPLASIAAALAKTCARFADPGDPVRAEAEAALAEHHAAPPEAVARVLDAGFAGVDAAALERWVVADLGDPAVLDRWVAIAGARRRAFGPRVLLAIQARGVPTTPVGDLLAGLLVKAPTWIKPARGGDDLAGRFAEALGAVDAGLAAAVVVERFESGTEAARVAMEVAEVVSATGDRETMEAIRREAGDRARVVLHGPRLSVAAIGSEALEEDPERALAALAADVAFAGQAGCLSPVVAWIEAPAAEVHALVEPAFDALVERWPGIPRREASTGERAAWAEWTALASVEAAAGAGGPTAGGAEAGWTVRARAKAAPPDPPPVPRALVLEPIDALESVAALCARRRGTVATVGLAADPDRVTALADGLAAAGVERIARLGRMQRPPPGWRRDGRRELGDLVRWTDLEAGEA